MRRGFHIDLLRVFILDIYFSCKIIFATTLGLAHNEFPATKNFFSNE